MKIKHNRIRLANDNIHLLDIFTDDFFLELGIISIETVKKLLNSRIVKLEDITDFNNQNHGVGASIIEHEGFKNILPYLIIDNINSKDESLQKFITYGLALYQDDQNKQRFAPLILIPITMHFEDGGCFIQIASKPISNSIFIEYLASRGFNVPAYEGDDIYSLEKYAMSFSKIKGIEVKVDNFLTFGRTLEKLTVMNHDIFSLNNNMPSYLGNKAYTNPESRIYNITRLDSRQRLAVQRASAGNSFGITGYLGTGKTTTLINIASDAIAHNKKVLYVSNMKETLQSVERIFNKYYIGGLLLDLTKSSRSIILGNSLIDVNAFEENNEEEIVNKLLENYEIIDGYENSLTERIYNFRFIDIIRELILLEKPKEDIDIDVLDGIYKHEYGEIIDALNVIDNNMKKIKVFNESLFINIPTNHNIKYPNQVMNLIYQIQKLFTDLNNNRKILQTKYHFKDITNYALFKNVINSIQGIDVNLIPESWKTDELVHFEEAVETYPHIKKAIYTIQELELYLDWDYQGYQEFEVNKAIEVLLGKYFTLDDNKQINNIIENLVTIVSKLHVGKHSTDIYHECLNRVRNILEWDIDETSDDDIDFVISFIRFINNNYISKKWLDKSKNEQIRASIIELRLNIERHNTLEKEYKKYFSDSKEIDQEISLVNKYISTNKKPSKFSTVDLDNLISIMTEYRELEQYIRKYKHEYFTLTGREHSSSDDMVDAFDKWNEFITSINNPEYENYIVRFLMGLNLEYFQNILNDFNKFNRVFNELSKIYKFVMELIKPKLDLRYNEKIQVIVEFVDYITNVQKIDNKMAAITKMKKDFNNFESYLSLQERLNKMNEIKATVVDNKEYEFLYGKLFNNTKTNVNELANQIKSYSNYVECFLSAKEVVNSFSPDNLVEIKTIIENSNKNIYELNQSFKLYNKIFKDGIGGFYYDEIESIIKNLQKLLDAKDELISYLTITDSLKVLLKYKLFVLNNLITNNKITNVSKLFKYKYFRNVYHNFMVEHNFLETPEEFDNTLLNIVHLEEALIKENVNHLKNLKAAKSVHTKHWTLKDHGFITKSSKSLFLTTTTILNRKFDAKKFDLIIIDDAHLLHANEYNKAIMGKQIIIAGDNVTTSTVFPNLIARMRPTNLMNFYYRYEMTPLSLLDSLDRTKGQFYPEVELNDGIKVVSKDEITVIGEIFLENETNVVNYYAPTITKKRTIVEDLVQFLLDEKMDDNNIYDIIRNRFNVFSYDWDYSQEADYSVILLEDIMDRNNTISETMKRNMLLARRKVIIIDEKEMIKDKNKYKTNEIIERITATPKFKFNNNFTGIIAKLVKSLTEKGLTVHGSYGEITLILEKHGTLYGVLIFSNPESTHIDILEDYRVYYLNGVRNGMVMVNIWVLELINKFDEVVNRICEVSLYEHK